LLDTARSSLRAYVETVVELLRAAGYLVISHQMAAGRELDAWIDVVLPRGTPARPGDGADRAGNDMSAGWSGEPGCGIRLRWTEDTGWSISHRLLAHTATPWRFWHLDLVPDPRTVVRFMANVLANDDDTGMRYPEQFRYHGQSLRPVIDKLAHYTHRESEDHSSR
jgi:hypothetical protein